MNSDILAHETLENSNIYTQRLQANCASDNTTTTIASTTLTGFLGTIGEIQFVNNSGVSFDDDDFDMDLLDALM